jgi:hypothetical protein
MAELNIVGNARMKYSDVLALFVSAQNSCGNRLLHDFAGYVLRVRISTKNVGPAY